MNSLRNAVLITLLSFSIVSYAAQFQAIHNSADPALDSIDVYIYAFGTPYDTLQDVPFRDAASVTVNLPFTLTIDIGIAPGNSTSANDTLKNFHITLPLGATYIGLIQGVADISQFAANPDGSDISLNAVINKNGRITSNNPGEVDIFFVHGVTDAPTIDISIEGVGKLFDNTPYGKFTDYFSLPPATYIMDITDSTGNTVLYSYTLDLSSYAGSALTLFASGFTDSGSNQNGESFGLFAATPAGNVIEFSPVTDIDEPTVNALNSYQLNQNYPNPFNPATTISYQLAMVSEVELTIYNTLGQEVRKLVQTNQPAGIYQVQWNGKDDGGKDVASGLYLYQLKTSDYVQSRKMLLLR
jgi:hypothetical protein